MKNVLCAISIVIISFLLVVPQAWTGSINVVDPEKVGMSAKVLAGIDEYAEVGIKGKLFKGAVVLVARHGKICYFKSYGEAEQGKAMKTDAVFRQASMTKPLVMAALMQFYDNLKSSSNVQLQIERRGESMNIGYQIE